MADDSQVDFYLLGAKAPGPEHLACRLALMAWERGHVIDIVTQDEGAARALNELMWQYPAERFLPHGDGPGAPVRIRPIVPEGDADVVINLSPVPLPEPTRFRRVLEIVPHRKADRDASRDKFRAYRALGLAPGTHNID